MTNAPMKYALIFTADASAVGVASAEVKREVAGVTAAAGQSSTAIDKHSAALDKDAAAAKRAADANRDLAAAEKAAKDEAMRAAGVKPAVMPAASAPPPVSTMPRPQSVPGAPASPPLGPTDADVEAARVRYLPLYAAQQQYRKELADVQKAEAAGAFSAEESAGVQARLTGAYDKHVESLKRSEAQLLKTGRGFQLQAHEQRNLMFQANDTVQTLLLGMPPMQVALQQGPQILQIYGSVGNMMRAMAGALTVARVGIALTASAAIIGATSWNGYLKSTKEVETAAAGLGRATAGSAADMEYSARAGAAAAGVSIKEARSMQVQFLRTGRIGAETFEGLIGVSKDFGATLGMSAKDAGAELAKMFAEPAKAADTLYSKYGLIDAATARQVTNLVAQNRTAEAQAVLLDALPARLATAEGATTAFGRAWEFVANKAKNAGDAIGGAIDAAFTGPTLEDQIDALRGRLESSGGTAKSGRNPAYRQSDGYLAGVDALADLTREKRSRDEAAARQRRDAEDRQRGAASLGIAEKAPVNANAMREEAVRNNIAALKAGQSAPGLDDVQRGMITADIEAKSAALDGLINRQQRTADLDRLDIQIQNERNPLLRAEMEARRVLLQMADQEVSAETKAAEAARARNRAMEAAIGAASAQITDQRGELEIRQRLTAQVEAGTLKSADANRMLQEELALRPLIAAAAMAEGEEKQRLNAVIAEQRGLYAALAADEKRASAVSSGQDYLRDQAQKLQMLQLEQALIGQSVATRTRVLALAQAEQDIQSRQIDASSAMADQMRTAAVLRAEETRELQKQVSAWERVQGAAESAIDGSIDALLKGDLPGALEDIAAEVTGLFAELAIKNPLKNAILGTDLNTMQDVGGLKGILGRLLGGKDTASAISMSTTGVSSMMVTAGTVTLTGGLAGLGIGAANVNGSPGAVMGQTAIQTGWSDPAGMAKHIALSPQEVVDLKKTVATEWVQSAGDAQAQGIIDTILNRKASGRWGSTVTDVVNAPAQFSDINGRPAWDNGRNSVDDLPLSRIDARTDAMVDAWLKQRAAGSASSIGGNLNYANPNYADAKNLGWINGLTGPVLGTGDAIHRHGTTPDLQRYQPDQFGVSLPGQAGIETRLLPPIKAVEKFGAAATVATGDLGTLGSGFSVFGSALSGMLQGGASGALNGFLGGLASVVAGSLGIPGFATGGNHAGGLRIVGEKGPELEYTGPSTILPSDLTRSLMSARSPASAANISAPVDMRPIIQVVNNSSAKVDARVEETTDAGGKRQWRMVMSDAVADGLTAPGGRARKTMQREFGAKRRSPNR